MVLVARIKTDIHTHTNQAMPPMTATPSRSASTLARLSRISVQKFPAMSVVRRDSRVREERIKEEEQAYKARVRHLLRPKSCLIIDPRTSYFMNVWDALTTVALGFTAIAIPYEVAFLPPATHALDPLFLVSLLVSVVFVADLVLQFFLMYPAKATETRAAGWVTDRSQIARHYLSTWFAIDVLSVAASGFDFISLGCDDDCEGRFGITDLRVLRMLRALRLVKLTRLVRPIHPSASLCPLHPPPLTWCHVAGPRYPDLSAVGDACCHQLCLRRHPSRAAPDVPRRALVRVLVGPANVLLGHNQVGYVARRGGLLRASGLRRRRGRHGRAQRHLYTG